MAVREASSAVETLTVTDRLGRILRHERDRAITAQEINRREQTELRERLSKLEAEEQDLGGRVSKSENELAAAGRRMNESVAERFIVSSICEQAKNTITAINTVVASKERIELRAEQMAQLLARPEIIAVLINPSAYPQLKSELGLLKMRFMASSESAKSLATIVKDAIEKGYLPATETTETVHTKIHAAEKDIEANRNNIADILK